MRLSATVAGLASPHLRLVATPVAPLRTLRPPAGSTWAEALRRRPGLDPRRLLEVAESAFLRNARAHQYRTFLLNPGPSGAGVDTGRYVYVTAAPRRAAPVSPPGSGGGFGALGVALSIAGGLAAAGGLAVAWAHL
jgi:hypothetical protein